MRKDCICRPTRSGFRRRYADCFEFVPIGHFIFNSSGIIVDVNSAGARLVACDRQQLANRPFDEFICQQSQTVFSDHRQQVLETGGLQTCDVKLAKPVENPVWVHLDSLAVKDGRQPGVQIRSVVKDFTDCKQIEITLRRTRNELEQRVATRTAELEESNRRLRCKILEWEQAQAALRESDKELRILSNQLLSAEEKERKRIARELHDSIGQALSAIKFSVENSLRQLGKDSGRPEVKALQGIVPLTQKTLAEVRRIVEALRPAMLDDLGILATITWLSRQFQNIYGNIHIKSRIELQEQDVPPALKTVIYRILQEALNNVAKHSGADRVRLTLGKSGERLVLTLSDNGIGFDLDGVMAENPSRRGFGLASMRERAKLSGGVFEIHTATGKGTSIQVVWEV